MTKEKFLFDILRGIDSSEYEYDELISLLLRHKFITEDSYGGYTITKMFKIDTVEFISGRFTKSHVFYRGLT